MYRHQDFLVVEQIIHNMTGSQFRVTWFWQNTIKYDLWPIGFFLKETKKTEVFSISVGSGQTPIKRQLSQNLTSLISIKLHEEKWGNKTMGTSQWAKAAVDNQNSLEATVGGAAWQKQLKAILPQLNLNIIKFLTAQRNIIDWYLLFAMQYVRCPPLCPTLTLTLDAV